MRPEFHLTALNPAPLRNLYGALIVGRVELGRPEETPCLKDVQPVLLHVPPTKKARNSLGGVTIQIGEVCLLVHTHL